MAVKKDPRLAVPIDGSLGAHLRKAREEANMTVDKVATALLLHPNTVAALEADAYDRLPAPTFVRGYLRGYARVLRLPSGPILEMYDRQGFEPPPLTPDVTQSQQAHTSDTAVRLVTYAVAAVLVLLVGLWWHSQEDGGFGISGDLFDWLPEPDRDPSLPADEGSATAAGGSEAEDAGVATEPIEPHESSRREALPVTTPAEEPASGRTDEDVPARTEADDPQASENRETSETPDSSAETGAGADANAEADAASEGVAVPTQAETDVPQAHENRETSETPDSSTGTDAEAGAETADVSADTSLGAGPASDSTEASRGSGAARTVGSDTARSGLVLEFAHESWVEVYDRERTRLFFGLVQPGRVLSFDGAQPFDVLLGFGKDVRVAIDGRAFDHTPFLKHGVARFSVGTGAEVDTGDAESADDTESDLADPNR